MSHRRWAAHLTGMDTKDFRDLVGAPIAVEDRVFKTAIDSGAPAWATRGTVVGFGRTRVYVRWDDWAYDIKQPHHSVRPDVLRVLKRCTCGARDFEGCFCGLSPREFYASR